MRRSIKETYSSAMWNAWMWQSIQSIRRCGYTSVSSSHLPHYTSRVILETIESNPRDSFNREGGCQLIPAWNKTIHLVKQQRACHKYTVLTKRARPRTGYNPIRLSSYPSKSWSNLASKISSSFVFFSSPPKATLDIKEKFESCFNISYLFSILYYICIGCSYFDN